MAEPVTLQQLFVGFAQALTTTRTFLERDAAAAQELHGADGSPTGRFAMGEVSFEVPFVVDGFVEREPELPELPRLRKPTLTDRERGSLERGAGDEAIRVLGELLEDAGQLNERFEIVRREPASAAFVEFGAPPPLPAAELQRLRAGASKAAVRKLEQTLEVYEAQRRAVADARAAVSTSPVREVAVRIDPEAFTDAPPAAQHKVTMTFTGEQARQVVVDGQPVSFPT